MPTRFDGDETPIEASRLDGALVYDLVYNPTRTCLLRQALAAGCDAYLTKPIDEQKLIDTIKQFVEA